MWEGDKKKLETDLMELKREKEERESVINEKVELITSLTAERDVQKANAENNAQQLGALKEDYEKRMVDLKSSYEKLLEQTKKEQDNQMEELKTMNKEQMQTQLELIKEQMQTTSEKVLKVRQEELGEQNKEQVSKIVDPLQKSLKDMQEALEKTKKQQEEALIRLDESINKNMEKSTAIGDININFLSYEKILLFNYRNGNSNADVNHCKFTAGCKRKF